MTGGAAPASFVAGLARGAALQASVARGARWIAPFTQLSASIGGGKGYGELLGTLADAILRPRDTEAVGVNRRRPDSIASQSRRSRATALAPHDVAATAAAGTGAPAGSAFPAAAPALAAAGVAAALARGLTMSSADRLRARGAMTPAPAVSLDHPAVLPAGVAAAAATLVLPSSVTPAAVREWRDRVASRVVHTMRSFVTTDGIWPTTDLGQLWTTAVGAAAAPAELLLRHGSTTTVASTLASHDAALQPQFSESGAAVPRAPLLGVDDAASVRAPQNELVAVDGLEVATAPAIAELGEEMWSRVMDEAAIPSLLPTAAAASAPVRPAPASLTHTQLASLEDPEGELEGLTRLAGRMKRVLDEEARRHGIDV